MIYLISQILLCLVLAALFGGALGWLAQRRRSAERHDDLRRALAQQKRLLAEARGDVAMLTDDFDDLRQRSQRELEQLRAENGELPILADNLEKSQLLVRQMIQRHEADMREVTNENTALGERVVLLEAQADVRERALAELESTRLHAGRAAALDTADRVAPPVDGRASPVPSAVDQRSPVASEEGNHHTKEAADALTGDDTSATARRGWASLPLDQSDSPGASRPDAGRRDADRADSAEPADESLDEVVEVDDEFAAELRQAVEPGEASAPERFADSFDKDATSGTDRPPDGARHGHAARPVDTEGVDTEVEGLRAADSGAADSGAADSGVAVSGAAVSGAAVSGAAVSGAADSGAEEAEIDDTRDIDEFEDTCRAGANDDDATGGAQPDDRDVGEGYAEDGDEDEDYDEEANATLAIDVREMEANLSLDRPGPDEPLFDPVDRQDDLQRIFGIGPVTEKALNELGITSYPQLAELERHEIEKIADALQIGPERIERDDWVGNARRQLEDVLEQL